MTQSSFISTLLAIPAPEPRFVGIYFLLDGDEIVYVGQSTNVPQRVITHQSARGHRSERWRTKWDRALWIPVPKDELDAYEGAAIRRLTPRYNTKAPSSSERDDEICAALNLPPCDVARLAVFLDRRRRAYIEPGKKRIAARSRRRKRMAYCKKFGAGHIKDPWVRAMKVHSRLLWDAVTPLLEAA